MFTVWFEISEPEYINFCKSEEFTNCLISRGINPKTVKSQELLMERLLLLKEGKSRMFTLCLY